ncbi:MAG: NUDIX domain-containing protein [Allomuricauda sp.]
MEEFTEGSLEQLQVKPDSYGLSITADVALFGFLDGALKVLLTKRSVGKLKDCWLLPGGVMEADETAEQCALKVLWYLTGIKDVNVEQVQTYTALNRHPVKRVGTIAFYALIKPESHPVERKLNVTEIKWFPLNELPKDTGFDHKEIIQDAHKLLKRNLKNQLIFGELLPKYFTLNELQTLYESILEEQFDRRNFRKKIFQMDAIKSTGRIKKGVKGGPLLYKKME